MEYDHHDVIPAMYNRLYPIKFSMRQINFWCRNEYKLKDWQIGWRLNFIRKFYFTKLNHAKVREERVVDESGNWEEHITSSDMQQFKKIVNRRLKHGRTYGKSKEILTYVYNEIKSNSFSMTDAGAKFGIHRQTLMARLKKAEFISFVDGEWRWIHSRSPHHLLIEKFMDTNSNLAPKKKNQLDDGKEMQYENEILQELKEIRQIVDAMYQDKIDQAKRMQESCKVV